ncbi:MAG: ATP-binding cassette domain-containing protein [Acidobacteriia bacterium]|nr:ATP-binding cassette domain-containing protein [Terriglobia bacterium]
MGVGIRTHELRKVFTTPPPLAAAGARFAGGGGGGLFKKKKDAKPNPNIVALDGVSLEVAPGEIFGLLGPNGAGKSTTVGILTTRVRPTSGEAYIGPYDAWKQQVDAKRLIGVVQQRPNLDFSLTAREILLFHAAYYGISGAERHERANRLLDQFQLTPRADDMTRGFSGGMMQRLSVARALMHDPQVLFLDEPSTGLDPQTRLLLWGIVREYNESGKTILLTTHNMEEADTMCHRVAIVDHGKVIALGTPAELKASIPGGYLVQLKLSAVPESLIEKLKSLSGVTEVRATGNSVDIYAGRGGSLIGEVAAAAAENSADLHDVHIAEPSLENLFLHHTGRSLRQ